MEDNLINVKVIKRQLTLKGYAVSVAMDGREALNILYADDADRASESDPIDIVLMDIQMPGTNFVLLDFNQRLMSERLDYQL